MEMNKEFSIPIQHFRLQQRYQTGFIYWMFEIQPSQFLFYFISFYLKYWIPLNKMSTKF